MRFIIIAICVLIAFTTLGQEGQFSQYFASGSLTNPAFSGTINSVNFNTNYKRGGNKDQEGFLELIQGTFTYPLRKVTTRENYFGSLGLTVFRERRGFQGVYRSQKILANGSYSIDLSEISNQLLIFGLQGGMVQQDISDDAIQWGSQFNRFLGSTGGFDSQLAGENLSGARNWYPVFNVGVIYTTYDNEDYKIRDYSFSAGISADNLNNPNVSFVEGQESRKSILLKGFASFQFPLGSRFYGYPSVYALNSNGVFQINTGMYISTFISSARSKVGVELLTGAWYRLGDSFIGLIGFKLDQYQIGFSADFNASNLGLDQDFTGNNLSAYEISLSYSFDLAKSYRRVSSPIF